jgi:prophage regulatory protein
MRLYALYCAAINSIGVQPMDAMLTYHDVQRITGLSRSTIIRLVKSGKFPTPLKIGDRAVAWDPEQIENWKKGLRNDAER